MHHTNSTNELLNHYKSIFLKHYKNAIQNANRTAIELECSFKCVFGRSTLKFDGTLLLSGGIK